MVLLTFCCVLRNLLSSLQRRTMDCLFISLYIFWRKKVVVSWWPLRRHKPLPLPHNSKTVQQFQIKLGTNVAKNNTHVFNSGLYNYLVMPLFLLRKKQIALAFACSALAFSIVRASLMFAVKTWETLKKKIHVLIQVSNMVGKERLQKNHPNLSVSGKILTVFYSFSYS